MGRDMITDFSYKRTVVVMLQHAERNTNAGGGGLRVFDLIWDEVCIAIF